MTDFLQSLTDALIPYMPYMIPTAVLLPALAAALALLLGRTPGAQRFVALGSLTLLSVLSLLMIVITDLEGIQTV